MSRPADLLGVPGTERRLALVIGVNKCLDPSLPSLRHAVSDAEALADVLHLRCGFEELLLTDQSATSSSIKRTVLNLARGRTNEDFLLVYFSGHGIPMNTASELGEVYIGSYDFDHKDVEEDENIHVSLRWLRDRLFYSTTARKVLIILDCDYAGSMSRIIAEPYSMDLEQRTEFYFTATKFGSTKRTHNALRLALTATESYASAREKDGHGLMTGLLLSALRGEIDEVLDTRGQISVQQLHHYLSLKLPEQRPTLVGDFAGLSCILASYPELGVRDQRSLIVSDRPSTYIPFPRNLLFHPRQSVLEPLETWLLDQGMKRKSPHIGVVGIVGLAGIGKTELAIDFAYRYQSRFPTAGVFWVNAEGKNFFDWQRRFAELAFLTNYLPPDDDVSLPESEARRAQHFCRYLATHKDALLILDNVEDPTLITSVLPTLASGEIECHLIYTSRNRSIPPGVVIYDVPPLSEYDALHLLLETTKPHILSEVEAGNWNREAEAAREICRLVGYHPLALVLLRGRLRQDTQLTLIDLAKELGELSGTQQTSLSRLFWLTWEQLEDETARRLFTLASFFPESSTIPIGLLGIAAGLSDRDKDKLEKACQRLQRSSLLQVIPENKVRMHPLIREFGQRLIADEYEQIESLLQHALTIYSQVLSPGDPDTATTLSNLALLYYVQERYELAEPLLQRTLTIYEQTLGPNHSDTAMTLSNLALLYRAQGQYERAMSLLQRALTIYEQTLGSNHSDTAKTLSNLALLYYVQERYELAIPLLQRALTSYELVSSSDYLALTAGFNTPYEGSLGPELIYFDKVTCLNDLGLFLQETRDIANAHRCFEQMLKFLEYPPASKDSRTAERQLAIQGVQDQLRTLIQAMDKVRSSQSKLARTSALNRAVGTLSHFPQQLNEFSQIGRLIIKRIVDRWREAVTHEADSIGKFVILEHVRSPYIFTPPVKDRALVGRDDIFERITSLWARPGQRNSLLIHGHRRMGKTSVAQAVVSRCNLGDDTQSVYLSLEGQPLHQEGDLYQLLSSRIWLRFKNQLDKPKAEDFLGDNACTNFDFFLALLNEVIGNIRLVLVLDEFEMLYNRFGVAQANEIIAYLRAQTVTYTWLALALVGLSDLDDLRLSYNSSILGWEGIRVSFLDVEQVKNVLANPSQDPDFPLDYTSEALNTIATFTSGQPYLVQVLGDRLVQRYNRIVFTEQQEHSGVFDVSDVQAVLEDPSFYSTAAAYFDGV
jgi:tetratricopeptide (TPR) repeat protein